MEIKLAGIRTGPKCYHETVGRPNADELTLLHVLFQCRPDLPPPEEFAVMIESEVPSVHVLLFLKVHGFTEEVRSIQN